MPNDGTRTLHFMLSYNGQILNRIGFVSPERCPLIDGETAWVCVHWWPKFNYRVVEQGADKDGTPLSGGL